RDWSGEPTSKNPTSACSCLVANMDTSPFSEVNQGAASGVSVAVRTDDGFLQHRLSVVSQLPPNTDLVKFPVSMLGKPDLEALLGCFPVVARTEQGDVTSRVQGRNLFAELGREAHQNPV